ncbi:MAG: CehA/McbA family metallohydrolase [Anaerolineae bacterium]
MFDRPGRFYRGNLHTHTTESDGSLSPQAVCQFYKDEGYDFLSITDHFLERFDYPLTDASPFDTPGFVTIRGAELHTDRMSAGELWHILANGLPADFAPPPEGETGPQLAQRAVEAGAFVSVANPAWYSLTQSDIEALGPDLHAIETVNITSWDYNDRVESWHIYDVMLSLGHRYFCLATDDAHFHKGRFDFGLAWVWVKAASLDPEALLAALKAGDYYNSMGPRIHALEVRDEEVYVRCSPAERVMLTGHGSRAVYVNGRGIREATLSLERFAESAYVRVIVRDHHGRRAWSNPIWVDTL